MMTRTAPALPALAGPRTRRIDLAGPDLRGVPGPEEAARRAREAAARLGPGEWVTGAGWDENLWPGRRLPDHRPLTTAVPERPVWLLRVDWHTGWANRAALDAAGVTRGTPDPPGGRVVRDRSGEPTGLLVASALDLVGRAQPPPSGERLKEWLRLALRRCAEVGLTGVHDAADPLLEQPIFVDSRDRLTLRTIKLLIDGTMGSRGAAFFEDYSDDPGNRGFLSASPEEIRRVTEQALEAVPAPDPRLRIEHLQCVGREDLARLARFGVIASMQPIHAALTRQDRSGEPPGGWHPEHRLTLEEALRAYTADAAYASFEEERKGRVALGLWADLTVLDRDITALPPSGIPGAGVALTVVGGRIVHEAMGTSP